MCVVSAQLFPSNSNLHRWVVANSALCECDHEPHWKHIYLVTDSCSAESVTVFLCTNSLTYLVTYLQSWHIPGNKTWRQTAIILCTQLNSMITKASLFCLCASFFVTSRQPRDALWSLILGSTPKLDSDISPPSEKIFQGGAKYAQNFAWIFNNSRLWCTVVSKRSKTSEIWTRCSAIAERPRCRVHYSFRQSRRLELGDNILRTL